MEAAGVSETIATAVPAKVSVASEARAVPAGAEGVF